MELPDFDLVFSNYQAEIVQDIKVDELSLKDKAMMIPAIKHKWVARTQMHKFQLTKLQNAVKQAIKKYAEASPIALGKHAATQAVLNNPDIQKIQDSIEKLEVIIEYLEKIEKLTSSLTFDCKNVIDLQKLETT